MSSLPRIGTAGWSYPHWNGLVYPASRGAAQHPLDLLAKQFDVVEINSSFYQSLKPELVKLWIKKIELNPTFQFTAKLHQHFTHQRILEDAEIAVFKDGVRPLLNANRLGALLSTHVYTGQPGTRLLHSRCIGIPIRREIAGLDRLALRRHIRAAVQPALRGTRLSRETSQTTLEMSPPLRSKSLLPSTSRRFSGGISTDPSRPRKHAS